MKKRMQRNKNPSAVALGKIKSQAKAKASIENGKLGGRPSSKAGLRKDRCGLPSAAQAKAMVAAREKKRRKTKRVTRRANAKVSDHADSERGA